MRKAETKGIEQLGNRCKAKNQNKKALKSQTAQANWPIIAKKKLT